ncbi:MalY/PatB family protein [Streptomyces sp. NPDC057654]|uniref:MalY/PatB family protein n=1 Tax=Streptomyces sp. NPDC057654 TaxID=3346196 RepID=UPI003697B82D
MASEFHDIGIDDAMARRSLKWGRNGPSVLGAWVAEMDFPLAPEVRQALHRAVDHGETGYPLRDIRTGLPAACADWLRESFGWSVPAEQIFLVPDILTGIGLGIDAYSPPGSAVVVPTPAYPPFFEIVEALGRPLVEVPLTTDAGRPTLDVEGIGAALAAGARTVVLCSPHNPAGRVFTPAELTALRSVVTAHGARVIADEVHAGLVYPGHRHVPYASLSAEAAAHTITVTSASKAWNIAGLKCSQVILTNPRDVVRWRQLPFHARHGSSTLGIAANIAAYREGDAWRRRAVRYLDGNRRFLDEALAAELPEVGHRSPEATYLAWLDCRGLGLDDPGGFFLRHAKVALSDGSVFGAAGRGFVRLNFATSRPLLQRIVTALAKAARERP